MKKLLVFSLAFILFVSSAIAAPSISKFTNHILKYNSAASVIGAKQIDEKNAIDYKGAKCFKPDTCMLGFSFDENEEIVECAVYSYPDSDAKDFLLTCMAVMLFLGDMDYEAFGHLLHQYSYAVKGEKPLFYLIGMDMFNITVHDDGSFVFVYTNTDRSYWF